MVRVIRNCGTYCETYDASLEDWYGRPSVGKQSINTPLKPIPKIISPLDLEEFGEEAEEQEL